MQINISIESVKQSVWKIFSASVQSLKPKMGFTTPYTIRNILRDKNVLGHQLRYKTVLMMQIF